ncbi:MAG: general stress protein CsbD [Bacteroidota bacterium]
MNATEAKASWNQQKGKLKQKFAILTEDDLLLEEGLKEELLGQIELIKMSKTKEHK